MTDVRNPLGFVLSDGWPDGPPEERVWVAVSDAPAGGQVALDVARAQLDGWMEHLDEDGLELIPTGRQEWHRQSPCLSCSGEGNDPSWRFGPDLDGMLVEGPHPACESCAGTGEQDGDEGYRFESCGPDDAGAVLFWVLEVAEREA